MERHGKSQMSLYTDQVEEVPNSILDWDTDYGD
jgi:hypothetical protein